MGISRAKAFIRQADQAGIRRIVFTGGEPMLHPREVRILIGHATERGMQSVLVTNGSWASSRTQARECLADLRQIGLQAITLSTDRYHLRKVPLRKLQWVLDVARDIGLQAGVKVARLRFDPIAEGICRTLQSRNTRVVVQEISPLGRASALRSAVNLHSPACFTGPGCFTPPLLLPDGALVTCCNLPARDLIQQDYPFLLGNLGRECLRSLLDRRSRDPLLSALRSHGPGTFLSLLQERGSDRATGSGVAYHNRCDLCFHLFRGLRDKYPLYRTFVKTPERTRDGFGAHV
jgi:hypothetical protein